ncbi:MAG: hypothetical protein ACRELD_01965 [Longimicrobiales bacterium]
MRRMLCVGVILLLTAIPGALEAQAGSDAASRGSRLGQNYPNPFNPTTRLPFDLWPEDFAEGQPVVVTIRIYNVLHQLVAVPTALNHPAGNGLPVDQLEYTSPGRKEVFWDGLDRSGRKVASGLYYVQFQINNRKPEVKKIFVAK